MAKKQATATALVIEKGIPLPNGGNAPGGFTDTLRRCEVGDSFVVPINKTNVTFVAKHIGMKVMTRKISPTERRVWRIE